MKPEEILAVSAVRVWCRSGNARQIREDALLTQAEVGELAGTDKTSIGRWESGKSTPRGDAAVRYYRALVQIREASA